MVDEELIGNRQEQTFMKVFFSPTDKEWLVSINLKGEFVEPELLTSEFEELRQFLDVKNTPRKRRAKVYINSCGGRSDTMIELMSILDKFDVVETYAVGFVGSAGFFVWAYGDERYIHPYSSIMVHSEAYEADGKILEHKTIAKHYSNISERMFSELCSFMTEEEIQMAKVTEVFFTPDELVNNRGFCKEIMKKI